MQSEGLLDTVNESGTDTGSGDSVSEDAKDFHFRLDDSGTEFFYFD